MVRSTRSNLEVGLCLMRDVSLHENISRKTEHEMNLRFLGACACGPSVHACDASTNVCFLSNLLRYNLVVEIKLSRRFR